MQNKVKRSTEKNSLIVKMLHLLIFVFPVFLPGQDYSSVLMLGWKLGFWKFYVKCGKVKIF